ncbi:MAG: heavy metal translocating P-type ATPase [Betaproteobacteria bacterium]|nr:heavy metal translocating P-type ATPase [Betaproteobacteria bacterium]
MKKHLAVSGMTCASCVAHVEAALAKVSGVKQATVNLATESAEVVVEEGVVEGIDSQLVRAVVAAGYGAELRQQDVFHQEDERIQAEIDREYRSLLISVLLSAPLIVSMLTSFIHPQWMLPNLLAFLLATPVQFYIGRRFLVGAWRQIIHASANMDVLVSLGTLAAYGLSLYQWLVVESHETYFEASAVVITLVSLGKYLEHRARHEASSAIRSLQSLRPDMSRLIDPGRPPRFNRLIATEYLMPGDRILVPAGERIGCDGVVEEGESEVDESLITGEGTPLIKQKGDKVLAGTLNGMGRLVVQVTSEIHNSTLAKIIERVVEAQSNKPPIQRLVDRVSQVFVPVVLLIALVTYCVGYYLGLGMDIALIRAVSVLVIACPCALGLATPVSIMVGTGMAAQRGILIRDASALEETHRITRVVFDKTGTLTQGAPQLTQIQVAESFLVDHALAIAAALQTGVTHPLASAVLNYAAAHNINAFNCQESTVLVGQGVEGKIAINDVIERYRLVSRSSVEHQEDKALQVFFKDNFDYSVNYTQSLLIRIKDSGEEEVVASLGFTDPVRLEAQEAIEQLQALHLTVAMLSGDHQRAAQEVAQQLGIKEVFANLTPERKLEILKGWQQQHEVVAMVGDGINDAPALAQANVGIAMGSGTDVANSAAFITLLRPDLRLVAEAIHLSKETWKTIQQNLFWAFFYNVIGIPLAATGYLSPVLAGFAMAFSSVSVVTNALLLRRK